MLIFCVVLLVPGELPPMKIAPSLALGFRLMLVLGFGLRDIFLGGNCPIAVQLIINFMH